jgi:hypothetical protein
VPNTSYQGYIPGGFGYMRQDPMTMGSSGGYPQVASADASFMPRMTGNSPTARGDSIPQDGMLHHQGALVDLPYRFGDPMPMREVGIASADPNFAPTVAPDFSGSGSTDTLVGSSGGLPGGADRFAADFNPPPVSGVTFMPGGFQAQGAELPAAGDPPPDTAGTGGVPYATSPLQHFAGYTDIGNGVMQTPAPRPSLGMRIARQAVPAVAGALAGPGLGMLASVIARSAFQGSFDKTQQYRGPVQGNYAPAAPNPYGGYTTGSSYSASPFTPAGYTAPNFSPVSGGSLYSYQPNGQGGGTYVDSQGRVHQY